MARGDARELIRKAQAAEIAGDPDRAVVLLEQAARLHLDANESARAAALLRHCLRLRPDRGDLRDAIEQVEAPGRDRGPRALEMAESAHEHARPEPRIVAATLALADEAASEALEEPPVARVRGALVPRQRGPVAAEPALEAWCSFCCRPRGEAGPLAAGPAGAFVCSDCVGAAARILHVAVDPPPARSEPRAPPEMPQESDGFIEAAVALSRALGWSLSEVRSLTPEERARAIKLAAEEPASKRARRRR